ncbi:hypothetical protein AGR8A_Lc20056 [Agrobacterium fabrum str. J-07]|nr:hypothetical protein AGR8A_Lc20056 [Agrobacterium fabrum str. J-07]
MRSFRAMGLPNLLVSMCVLNEFLRQNKRVRPRLIPSVFGAGKLFRKKCLQNAVRKK